MKKTIAGAVLLTLLFIGALFNAGYQKSVLSGLIEIVDTADAQMASGDLSAAFGTLSGALDAWDGWEEYTHIFIRHTDVESVSAAFYELLSDLCEDNPGSARGSFLSLRHSLESIIKMEQPRPGSIF